MSHLHKDHSGGISCTDETDGARRLSFPTAKYYIQKQELEFALSEHSSSYIKRELACLKDSPHLELLNGNGDIARYIHYEMTSAHSRYHQVFWIRENGKTVFFGGDDAPQYQQMKSRYVAKYDYNGKKCMQLRHEWWKKGTEEHWTFLFYHDIKRAIIEPSAS
jgi:glyoxylase-like metal-dependent hydrolase (beta-lactamase superfamily II)